MTMISDIVGLNTQCYGTLHPRVVSTALDWLKLFSRALVGGLGLWTTISCWPCNYSSRLRSRMSEPIHSCAQRGQVPNIQGLWTQIPFRAWFSGPETLNTGYLDPPGCACRALSGTGASSVQGHPFRMPSSIRGLWGQTEEGI